LGAEQSTKSDQGVLTESVAPIGCAVIGCGHWGPNHIRVLSELPGSRVVAAADVHAERLDRATRRFPQVRRELDYRTLLADPAIDAVVVATAASRHVEMVRAALEAGKHVLCEKPLCIDPADAAALVALAARRGRTLMIGHTFMFNAGIRKLKELIEAGELGEVRHFAAVRTNLGPIRTDVNAAYDLACHDISIINWMLGARPLSVSARGACYLRPGIEDVVSLTLRYPRDIVANLRASWYDPKKARDIVVVGSRRMASWDDLDTVEPLTIYDKGAEPDEPRAGVALVPWDRGVSRPAVALQEPLKMQDQAFLDAVRGAGPMNPSDGAFSIGIIQTLAAANRSIAADGAPVALDAW
jgi:predicted dehydrogenase